MQQREEDAAGAEQQGGSPTSQDAAMHAEALDSGLFGGRQPAELLWSGASPPLRQQQQQHTAAIEQRHMARVPGPDGRAADGTASQVPQAAAAGGAATLRTRSATSLEAAPAIVGRRGSGGEVSGSLVRSVFDAVRSGFSAVGRALLPPSLHQLLDGEPALERMWWRPVASTAAWGRPLSSVVHRLYCYAVKMQWTHRTHTGGVMWCGLLLQVGVRSAARARCPRSQRRTHSGGTC
jgi:hypothetical protein